MTDSKLRQELDNSKQKIDPNRVLKFGKSEGKRLSWVIEHDPSYAWWLWAQGAVYLTPTEREQALIATLHTIVIDGQDREWIDVTSGFPIQRRGSGLTWITNPANQFFYPGQIR